MLHDAHELADLIQKMERLTEDELIQFIKSMPDGEFIKDSDGKFYKCKYIGMMLNGSIFPLYKSCSLNPLYKDKDGKIHQSTFTCRGMFIQRSENIEEAIRIYNDELIKYINYFMKRGFSMFNSLGDIIVAYHEFEEEVDQ